MYNFHSFSNIRLNSIIETLLICNMNSMGDAFINFHACKKCWREWLTNDDWLNWKDGTCFRRYLFIIFTIFFYYFIWQYTSIREYVVWHSVRFLDVKNVQEESEWNSGKFWIFTYKIFHIFICWCHSHNLALNYIRSFHTRQRWGEWMRIYRFWCRT